MFIQKIVMSNPVLTRLFMSKILSSSTHENKGKKYAMKVFKTAIERTIAYPRFLEENGINTNNIKTIEDFNKLPIIDKKSYIDKFSREELCLDGDFSNAYTIETSSGHSGGTYYWYRLPEEDEMFPKYLEYAFRQFYGIDRMKTLVIITLAMGTWTSGFKMSQALQEVAVKGKKTGEYSLTVMNPGTNVEEILKIVQDLSSNFGQTIIVGYPPFVKLVIDSGTEEGIKWEKYNTKIGLGGEGYSEAFRDYIAGKVGVDSTKDFLGVSGGYGAADVGMSVGREYPITVLIRRLCQDNKELTAELFGGSIPNLFQYSPSSYYIEEIDDELIYTVLSGIPLVRYNIHDRGGVIPFEKVMETLDRFNYNPTELLINRGYTKEDIWRLPFFYCFGRSDGTVFVGGANVYTENIEEVLMQVKDSNILNYKLSTVVDKKQNSKLLILLEYRNGNLSDLDIANLCHRYHGIIIKGLQVINKEFRNSYRNDPEIVMDPVVRIYPYGSGSFTGDKDKIKQKHTI